ncbi:MAG: hypothetical protein ACLFSU_05515 [Acholeplasmataceae bacterium]
MIIESLYVLVLLMLLLGIYLRLSIAKRKKRLVADTLDVLSAYGQVERTDKAIRFITERAHYDVIFFHLPRGAELTINSRTIWEIEQYGRSRLIRQDLTGKRKRIIILYPSESIPKRYINENEMVLVRFDEPFYNTYLVNRSDLKTLLEKDIL